MFSIEASSLDCAESYYSILLLSIKKDKGCCGYVLRAAIWDELGSGSNGIPGCLNNKVANAYGPALQLTHDA